MARKQRIRPQDTGRSVPVMKNNEHYFLDVISAPLPEDASEIVAERVFPKLPAHNLMSSHGLSENSVKAMEYIRQMVPRRPKHPTTDSLNEWKRKLSSARLITKMIYENPYDRHVFSTMMSLHDEKRNHRDELELREYLPVDIVSEMRNYRVFKKEDNSLYALYKAKQPLCVEYIEQDEYGEHETLDSLASMIISKGLTNRKRNSWDSIKLFSDDDNKFYVGVNILSGHHLVLSQKYSTREEAEKRLTENFETYKDAMSSACKIVPLREGRHQWRESRKTSQYLFIPIDEMMDKFTLGGITFGRCLKPIQRQFAINSNYDAFLNLMAATGLTPKHLGLEGMVLTIGTGNSRCGYSSYISATHTMNLPSNGGVGDFGFTWFLALDTYLAKKFCKGKNNSFAAACKCGLVDFSKNAKLTRVANAYKAILALLMDENDANSLMNRCGTYGTSRRVFWISPQVVMGHAFEGFLMNKTKGNNKYLVNYLPEEEFEKQNLAQMFSANNVPNYPIPTESEIQTQLPLFEELFAAIKSVLRTRETKKD